MPDDLVSFIGQKAFIEKDGELLILHDPQMGLDLPGGKIMEGETDLAAALQREVQEETTLVINVGKPFFTWFFTIPLGSGHRSAGKKIFCVGYKCTYVSGVITLSAEHDSYTWINKNNYQEYLNKTTFAPALEAYFNP
jgi:8-oxo-dGTP pyrophosphatase MutT (NUDIX family)